MKKKMTILLVVLSVIIVSSVTVFAMVPANPAAKIDFEKAVNEKVEYTRQCSPAMAPEQQAEYDKMMAEKEAVAALYQTIPQEEPIVPEYFYQTAEKLGVDIEGLTPSEIMIKVKEAEVIYMGENTPVITPEQQAEFDKMIAEKEAMSALYQTIPQEEPVVPEYFYQTAEKLGVDIKGLTPSEIMIKVKEAEVKYMEENSPVITPEQQAAYDRITAEKEALISNP